MDSKLEKQFDEAMKGLYDRAKKECNYPATRFFAMLCEHRGIKTAQILLRAANVSEGYIALWEKKRLDLTVEALILEQAWSPLFSEEERDIARKRLAEYGYKSSKP